jgi:hypothetical protein
MSSWHLLPPATCSGNGERHAAHPRFVKLHGFEEFCKLTVFMLLCRCGFTPHSKLPEFAAGWTDTRYFRAATYTTLSIEEFGSGISS